jgi:hypothetical protein
VCLALALVAAVWSGCSANRSQSDAGANVFATVDSSGKVIERGADGQPEPTGPDRGRVEAHWHGEDLRLSFRTAAGEQLKSSSFTRRDSQNAPQAIRRGTGSPFGVANLPGVYRAELSDVGGTPAGWVQVRILRHVGLPRAYDGDVPPAIQGPLFADAVALLDAEIESIIRRNALPEDRFPEGLAP